MLAKSASCAFIRPHAVFLSVIVRKDPPSLTLKWIVERLKIEVWDPRFKLPDPKAQTGSKNVNDSE